MASFRSRIGEALAVVLGAEAGLAAAGAVLGLGGRFATGLDVFSHFALIYGVLALVSGLVAVAFRLPGRTALIAVSAVGLLASGALIAPEFVRRAEPRAAADAPDQIKVIQVNAQLSNANIRPIADWLLRQHADIITITEARHDLRDLLVEHGWKTAGGHGYLVIFTREHYVRMDRPQRAPRWDTTFINATYPSASGPLEAVTLHLVWPTDPIVGREIDQAEEIVEPLPRRRMVLTGDFNATPWSAELRRLDRSLGLVRRDRAVPTWPAKVFGHRWPLPFLPIDHVYAGRGWATVKVERGPWLGSDHYPLIVTLAPVAPR